LSYNPYAPMYPGYGAYPGYGGGAASSSTGQAVPGFSSPDQVDAANAAYQRWLGSPLGQAQDTAAESAASYARQQADAQMANAKQELSLKVATLKQQGRYQEADIALKKGDQQISRDRLAQELKIHQDTFGLQQQQFGLDRAKTYADYASTPDRLFMLGDLNSALTRAGQGLGPQPYGATGQPVPKTMAGFDALSAPPGGGGSGGGASGSSMLGSGQMGASGASADVSGGAGSGSTTDPRSSAIQSIMKASPASDELGLDGNDVAALGAIQNIIKMKNPGVLQRMRPGQQQAFSAGASRLGYYAPDVVSDLKRSGIGQGAATAY